MLVFLSVIENIVVPCPSFLFVSPKHTQFYSQLKSAVEPRKNFIMPGHYKKIMPAQQPIRARVLFQPYNNIINHKNYNFLVCDWFKKVLFSTNSLATLLSDSLLLDSLLLDSLLSDSLMSQSHSKMQFKSTNHIQSCNYVCVRARCCP